MPLLIASLSILDELIHWLVVRSQMMAAIVLRSLKPLSRILSRILSWLSGRSIWFVSYRSIWSGGLRVINGLTTFVVENQYSTTVSGGTATRAGAHCEGRTSVMLMSSSSCPINCACCSRRWSIQPKWLTFDSLRLTALSNIIEGKILLLLLPNDVWGRVLYPKVPHIAERTAHGPPWRRPPQTDKTGCTQVLLTAFCLVDIPWKVLKPSLLWINFHMHLPKSKLDSLSGDRQETCLV